jgi:tetratricopeptide (TPR) repeat protein
MRGFAIGILLLVSALVPASADAKWTQVRSANFVFVGDASEGQIRRIAQKLEQFREVMLRALPGATAASPVPTVVMVFATDRSLQPVAPLFNGHPIEVGGYFQSGEDRNYIAIDAEYIDSALLTIFHEYSHFLVNNSVGPLPPWANEGLAEVYELVQERDGGKKAMVGLAPQQHVELLKGSTLIPIRELLAIDHGSPVYNEGSRRGVFYAQSWALVHYLSFGNPERGKQFRQFLANVRGGSAPAPAFNDAFGDIAVLDRELFMYVRNYLFPAVLFDFGEKVAAGSVQKGQTLDDAEAAIYLADLQGRVGRLEESRARLGEVLKQNPNAARAHAVLGLQAFRANQMDTALPLLEKAASLGGNDGWVQIAYGRALVTQLGGGGDASAAAQRARTVLGRAVELDPDSAFAAAMLGYVELILETDATHAASLLERAVRLAPAREQYRLFLAQAWMRQREFAKATSQLGPLMASGRDPQIRSQAREMLTRVAQMQNPSPTAPPAAQPGAQPTAEQLAILAALSRTGDAPAPPPDGPPRGVQPGPTMRLDLRPVGAGETRARGQFTAIECGPAGIVLVVQADTGVLRLRAKELREVDFISYRTDTAGSVSCGTLPKPQVVLATYRVGPAGAGPAVTSGDAVAIELLPDDYVVR